MSEHSFNLVGKKWIPCMLPDGTAVELGLLETLTRAHEIREVFDQSPLVTASLHRLLLTILYRVMDGPASVEKWSELWKGERFDSTLVSSYFSRCYDRFDLFDDTYPFFQVAGLDFPRRTPIRRLPFEFACQNNATLFDHSRDDQPQAIPAATAALWLLANQAFAPTSGKSSTIHSKDSPWSRTAVVLLDGDNLFETLMLNLVPFSIVPRELLPPGVPLWERVTQRECAHGAVPEGYLDYLTMQSRFVRLLPQNSGEDAPTVSECFYAQGRSVAEDFRADPFAAYRTDSEGKTRQWQLRGSRRAWRDSSALFARSSSTFRPPLSFGLLRTLIADKVLRPSYEYRVTVRGQNLVPGQPAINFWKHDRMPLPLEYLEDESLVEDLHLLLEWSENTGSTLYSALRALAASILSPQQKSVKNTAARPLVTHMDADGFFWSQLETAFHSLARDLPHRRDAAMGEWRTLLRHTVWLAFSHATRDLDRSARSLKAMLDGKSVLAKKLPAALGER